MASVLAAESPVDLDPIAIDLPVPGVCLPLKQDQSGDSAFSETLPGKETDFDFGLVQPTPVFGCVVNRETVPEIGALFLTEVVGKSLLAVGVKIVHDQMDGASKRITADDSIQGQLGR